MLSIRVYEDKPTIITFCRKCKKVYTEALYMYMASDGETCLAAALFEVAGEQVQVVYYESAEPDDHYLFDAVLRAGINYAAEHGIENGYIPEEFRQTHDTLFAQINFPIQPTFNITNFFRKYKNCAKIS